MPFELSSSGPQFATTGSQGEDQSQATLILRQFATQLQEYQLSKLQEDRKQIDVFDLIADYTALATEHLLSKEINSEEFESCSLEVRLWNLLSVLLRYRYSAKPDQLSEPSEYSSNIVYAEKIFQEDEHLYEIYLLMNWVTENALGFDKPAELSTNAKWLQSQLNHSLDSFDPDAPQRLSQQIHPDDKEQDNLFYKYILRLLLSGRYDEALNECQVSNNWTLRMILIGRNEFFDPILDASPEGMDEEINVTSGIKKRALWRRTVYLLSKDESLLKSEKAVYAFLIGTVDDCVSSAETYDDELLVYLNAVFNSTVEANLTRRCRIPNSELITTVPECSLTIQQILNIIAESRPEESSHPLRVLMGSVITNNIAAIVHSSLSYIGSLINDSQEDQDDFVDDTTTLRIITHLTVLLSDLDPCMIPLEDKTQLITTYTLILRKYELYDLIPVYVSQLPPVAARDSYSIFLSELLDSEERTKQLRLARLYGLPLEDILNRTVARVFDKTESYYNTTGKATVIQTDADDNDEVDFRLMRAVEWFIEEKMYTDALKATLTLSRRFLTNGKVLSLTEFHSRNDISELLKQYDIQEITLSEDLQLSQEDKDELKQYSNLLDILNSLTSLYSTASPSPILISQTQSALLNFIPSFLTSSETDLHIELRTLYVPHLLITLHKSLTASRYYNQAMNLVEVVASENLKLYTLFKDAGRLTEFVGLVAECGALMG